MSKIGPKMTTKIVIECDGKYFAHDGDGCPHWSNRLFDAKSYPNLEDAVAQLDSSDFVKMRTMSGGTIYPPTMIHSALNLNIGKMSGAGVLRLCSVELKVLQSRNISGSLEQQKISVTVTKEEEETLKALRDGRAKVILT